MSKKNQTNEDTDLFINELLAAAENKYSHKALERIRETLILMDEKGEALMPADPQQSPSIYFPFINNQPWPDPAKNVTAMTLENSWQVIQTELFELLASRKGFQPYMTDEDKKDFVKENNVSSNAKDDMNIDMTVFYFRDLFNSVSQKKLTTNRKLCPKTTAIIKSLPNLATITMFSALNPNTKVPPHCGVDNVRQIIHLGLSIPKDCNICVAGEQRTWQEGKCLMFDGSFFHEVWNNSNKTRIVLIADIWHPDLTPAEIFFFKKFLPAVFSYDDIKKKKLHDIENQLVGKKWWRK